MSLSFLVIDSGGLGVDIARKLGQEGHKTFYYNAWQSAYPVFEAYAPGVGIPEITKVLDYASHLDEVDCIVFPDTGMGELAHYLREKGYNVFGAGRGEELENNRGLFTDVLAKLGIKHPVTHKVNGLTEAIEKLKELFGAVSETNQLATGKCFVKFDIWRGSLESFPVDSVESAEQMFDVVRAKLGPYADSIPMVIQETVEGIECFDGETEVFTNLGWIKFKDLKGDELIYSSDFKEKFDFYKIKRNIKYRYKGKMYRYEGQCIDMLVTPNHKLWCKSHSDKYGSNGKLREEHKPYRQVSVSEMTQSLYYIPKNMLWSGEKLEFIKIPECEIGNGYRPDSIQSDISIPVNIFLNFLGWFLSEGCLNKDTYGIFVTQRNFREDVEECFNELGFNWNYSGSKDKKDFRINSKQLYNWLAKNCYSSEEHNAFTKKIPEFIKNLSPELIREFLDSFVLGDGSVREDGLKIYRSANKSMADDLQELVLKTGSYATMNEIISGSIGDFQGRTIYRKNDGICYCVTEWIRKQQDACLLTNKFELVDFDDYVYDVEVEPYHSLYIRRNGKVFWSSNCGFDVFFNGKDFVKPLMWGFENSGDYLGFITNEATFFESDLNKIAEYLRSVNYRGAFSMETIWDGRDHYWLDWTGRFPLPLGLMYPTFIQNLGELFLGIAKGEDVSSQLPLNEYIGCVALASEEAGDKFVSIKGGKNTKFMRYMMDDKGNSYAVPGMSLLGISSAQGKNLEELKANLNKETDELNIFFGKFNKNAMDDIEDKYIKPLLKQGILFKEERKMSRAGLILHYLSETEDSIDSQVIKSRLQLKMSELGLSNVMVDDVVDSGDGEIEVFMSDSDGKSGSADFKYIEGKAVAVIKDIIVSLGALPSALHKESGMYINLYELAWLDKEMMTNIVDAMGLAVGKNEPVSALKYDEFGNISGGQR